MSTLKYKYNKMADKNINNMLMVVESVLRIKENMEVQTLTNENIYILQARVKKGDIKKFVGMDKVITVQVSEDDNQIIVEIGEQKWIDKGVTLAVSMFVLWPLAITSSVGLYNQKKLAGIIKKTTDSYMDSEGVIFDTDPTLLEKIGDAIGSEINSKNMARFFAKFGPQLAKEFGKIISRL